jgi:hypothetical protein
LIAPSALDILTLDTHPDKNKMDSRFVKQKQNGFPFRKTKTTKRSCGFAKQKKPQNFV